MAQLRHEYHQFLARNTEVISIGPEGREAFRKYWSQEEMPFVGLADPKHTVADLYGQEVSLLKLGRMPEMVVVDLHGRVRYRHYARSMSDIPRNEDMLALLSQLNREQAAHDSDSVDGLIARQSADGTSG